MKKALLTLTVVLVAAAMVSAAVPTVTLSFTYPTSTTWQLYATTTADNAGLASFDISFGNATNQVLTSTQLGKSLTVPFPGQNLSIKNSVGDYVGFASSLRSNGTVAGGAVADISNGQGTLWTADGGATDQYNSTMVIQGIGRGSANAMDYDGTTVLKTITNPALIAQGTCSAGAQFTSINAVGNVLAGTVGSWAGPGNTLTAVFQITPEPASISLLIAGGLALLRRKN